MGILLGFLVGLIIFLYGIQNFGREIISLSGPRFRKLIAQFTSNRWNATFLGIFVTSILQSSTATTLITVSLVSSGLLSFSHSLGIIFGANIGTTITAQLVAFKVTKFAPLFIILGFTLTLLGKNIRYLGKGLFYFGLLFFGLALISDAVAPIKDNPNLLNLISNLSNTFVSLLVGMVLTAIVHSSSVSTGIIIVLAANGLVSLEQALPYLLGTNIGTTATTLVASTRMNLYARRAAIAHMFFNIIGVCIFLPFLEPFTSVVLKLGGDIPRQIANAHTLFNVTVTLFFLILLKPFQKLIEFLIQGEEEEILLKTKYLTDGLPKKTSEAFFLIEKELQYAVQTVHQLFSNVELDMLEKAKPEAVNKLEALSDILDESIEKALLELSRRNLSDIEAHKITLLIRISNYIEQLGDIGKDIHKLPRKIRLVSGRKHEYLNELVKQFEEALNMTKKTNIKNLKETDEIIVLLDKMKPKIAESYSKHIEQLKDKTYFSSGLFVEYSSLIETANKKLKEILRLIQEYQAG